MDIVKIGIGVLCWIETDEQLPELKRCLDSLQSFYPVIVVNGKWTDIDGDNVYSTQKASDLMDSYSNVVRVDSSNFEWYNRNLAIKTANKLGCDSLFWVDTDEWVEMPLGKDFFIRGLNFGDKHTCYAHYYDEGRGGCCRMVRGINDLGNTKISKQHNKWLNNKKDIFKDPYKAPRGFTIYSDRKYRSMSRQCRMKERNVKNPIH